MKNFYFIFPPKHQYYGGWIRVIQTDWRSAMQEYYTLRGRDYFNFFEESLFDKQKYPKGEILII